MSARGEHYPLAPMQLAMLLEHARGGDPGVDVEQIVCELREPVDERALAEAWERVVARHAILRSSFQFDGVNPVQVVHPRARVQLVTRDLRELDDGRAEIEVARFLETDRARGFDLSEAPAMRLTLLRTAEARYVLVWTFHHILLDGRSIFLVLREAMQIYDARGAVIDLPRVPPFRDHLTHLETLDSAASDAFFRGRLVGVTPTPLPFDGMASTTYASIGHRECERVIPLARADELRTLADRCDATLHNVIQAAWAILLARHSGEQDVVFGATRAGRRTSVAEADSMVGVFINTLPVRVQVPLEKSVADLIRDLRTEWVALRPHEHTSLLRIREMAEIGGDVPLFESFVVFETYELPKLLRKLGGAWADRSVRQLEQSGLPLGLAVYAPDRVVLKLEYDPNRFARDHVERMLDHLDAILRAMPEKPGRAIGDLPMLSRVERRVILDEWNDTGRDFPRDVSIHELVRAQIERTPEAIAVRADGKSLSYAELGRRSRALAAHLVNRGVGPGSRVGVCLRRKLELATSILGILETGAAYVPLDPAYPDVRLATMIADAEITRIVTSRTSAQSLPREGIELIEVDHTVLDGDESAPLPRVPSDAIAYVIYTSGTTGVPKGVPIRHRSVVNHALAMAKEYGLGPGDRVPQFASISFDIAVEEIFPTWISGATLVMRPRESQGARELTAWIEAERVTVLQLPTAYFNEWVRAINEEKIAVPHRLRLVVIGGERASLAAYRAFRALAGDRVRFVNAYGPTEATVTATLYDPGRVSFSRDIPIGKPIANTTCYVLDPRMNAVPIGVPGELYIGGEGLTPGYLNDQGTTRVKLVASPFRAGERLYRTGDRARYLPDGNLEFLGRVDEQVKIRGFRIELGEIEAVLERHEAVRSAVVTVREASAGDSRLVGYVVMEGSSANAEETLRAHLERVLPAFMVPSAIVAIDSLPMLPNGKVNRRALPEPDAYQQGPASLSLAPRDAIEEAIARVFRELLDLSFVASNDDFFRLGGHSLLAMRAASRLSTELGIPVSVRMLFESRTLAQLAATLRPRLGRAESDLPRSGEAESRATFNEALPSEAITPRVVSPLTPLSFSQQQLWFLEQVLGGIPVYNMPAAVRLRGSMDVRALERALDDVVQRHEILRTRYVATDGVPSQEIVPFRLVLAFEPLVVAPGTSIDDALESAARAEAQKPFALEIAPPIRAKLVRIADGDHLLLVTMHHIASDGWSVANLFQEISARYEAHVRGDATPAAPLPLQYADYAVWQRRRAESGVYARELAYWKAKLTGRVHPLELPTDRPRPPRETYSGGVVETQLPDDLLTRVSAICAQEQLTPFMYWLAAFNVLLFRYSRERDIFVGCPISSRSRAELEPLIGYFINTVVLRADLGGDPTCRSFLQRTRKTALDAYAHRNVPFEQVMGEVRPERSASYNPLFQVLFSLENAPDMPSRLGPMEAKPYLLDDLGIAKCDLSLVIGEREGGTRALLEYNSDLFDRETATRMLRAFVRVAERMLEDLSRPTSALDLLDEDERATLLTTWNDTKRDFPRDKCLHELVVEQIERTPDAIAISKDDATLTYRELDRKSARVAAQLREMGVRPNEIVALAVPRSLPLAYGLLGILRSGAAYLPLDLGYPEDRLRFMLGDAGVRFALTKSTTTLPHVPGLRTLQLDGPWLEDGRVEHAPAVRPSAESIAYVIYTSGSTGKPKGVPIRHRSVVNHALATARAYELGPRDRVPHFASISFDIAVEEIFPTWISGGRVVIRPELLASTEGFARWLDAERVTVLQLPTAYFHEWVIGLEEAGLGLPPGLRLVVIGGERASPAVYARWLALSQGRVRFVNAYGPTESTVTATLYEAKGPLDRAEIPIGRPIANTKVLVLDETLDLCPIGVAGELFIGGEGLTPGYLHRPELTAQRFVASPFAPHDTLYRTGDRVRVLADGNLEFLGRVDDQVKVRGFRIELGEVEHAIRQCAGVEDATSLVVDDPARGKQLAAYVVGGVSLDEVRARLKAVLPDYMVPTYLVAMPALPKTPNGKIDRRALPAPAPESVAPTFEGEGPRNLVEITLHDIWKDVLGLPSVGIHDNFFRIGGHSLQSIRILDRANKMGLHLTPAQFFDNPTIAALAAVASVRKADADADASELIALRSRGTRRPIFFTHSLPGDLLGYGALVHELGDDHPCFGFQSVGLTRVEDAHVRIPRMARHYVDLLLKFQPEGPYDLVGWCFGAHVAIEMAREIRARGHAVGHLVVMEAFPVIASPIEALKSRAKVFAKRGPKGWARVAAGKLLSLRRESSDPSVQFALNARSGPFAHRVHVYERNLEALESYTTTPFATPIFLVRGAEPPGALLETDYGWSQYTRVEELVYVPAEHETLLAAPHVQHVAKRLRSFLSRE